MSGKNGALDRGRARMEKGAPFPPSETPILLAAGLDQGFSPATNTTDAKIDRFLAGAFGANWRETTKPRAPTWTPAEARAIGEAGVVVAGIRLRLKENDDEWWAVEDQLKAAHESDLPRHGGTGDVASIPLARQLAALSRRAAELERQHGEITGELERALGVWNDLQRAADERRRAKQLQGV